jgi:hypothetical protein
LAIVGLILGAVVIGVIGIFAGRARTYLFGPGGKNEVGLPALGILDPHHADGDVMMTSVATYASYWKATGGTAWWGLTYSYVGPDGTMDLEKGGAVVEYAWVWATQSPSPNVRRDSIKEFRFSGIGVNYDGTKGLTDPNAWKRVKPPPTPTCTIKKLAKALGSQGLVPGKTVRITYDPAFPFAPSEPSWHVIGDDPKINAFFSMATCDQTTPTL